ncbi:MAG: phenylalanine--tRNA ligase beta subunit-related protein, partial [Patescibacteria group bacterium]|nr:phenylalanine--tRNA ligase beta subunit-related protein [Patescibacteria group bacterium]
MKILYSQIKEYIPALKASPKEIGEALTLTGSMMESFEKISYKGRTDYLIGLEIRQNRADCLSVIGIAREVAAYYGLKAKMPDFGNIVLGGEKLDIGINKNAVDFVKRIWAIKFCGLENRKSPEWLIEYLSFYEINSINLLVDLSNYVMLATGYPSHLIDADKIIEPISWNLNNNFKKTTTLDGTNIQLSQKNELIVEDKKDIIALAGIVGTKYSPVDMNSKSIILEMAVYDRTIIRQDSRTLKIVTEASHRLEKDLDPNGVDCAARMLTSLILKYCKGEISSKIFDYYPQKRVSKKIKFDRALPSVYAGVEIGKNKAIDIFKNLRFKVEGRGGKILVTPPTDRMDISMEQDLTEEAVRMYGYDKIPSDEIPKLQVVKDITPKNIILCEKIRDILAALGYDEVLSWLLTKQGTNKLVNYLNWDVISAQNSVNELYPDLRQSIAPSLISQFKEYKKKNVQFIDIFEIGKVFGDKK